MVFIDGRPMQLDLMDKGDTEEDEALKHVVKANPKQRRMIGQRKGKERVHQQSGRETFLVIIIVRFPTDQKFSESSSQSHRHDASLLDSDPDILDDLNENPDDWIDDQHTVEVSQKSSSAMTIEVMLLLLFPRMFTLFRLQRPFWIGTVPPHMHGAAGGAPSGQSAAGPTLTQGVVGIPLTQGVVSPPSTQGVVSLPSTQGVTSPPSTQGVVSLPSTQSVTSPPLTQGVVTPPLTQGVVTPPLTQGIVTPPSTQDVVGPSSFTPGISILTLCQSFLGSSQGSSVDVPHAPPPTPTTVGASSRDIPAIGLCHLFVCPVFY